MSNNKTNNGEGGEKNYLFIYFISVEKMHCGFCEKRRKKNSSIEIQFKNN
jgi:hypothetical protein